MTEQSCIRQGGKSEVESRYEMRFSVKEEVKAKLHKVQALLSGKHPKGLSLEATLDLLLDEYLERNSREAKLERARKRIEKQKQREESKKEENAAELSIGSAASFTHSMQEPVGNSARKRRPIPAETKRKVFERDKYCCSYRSPGGVVCGSNWDLEIDHLKPVAFGGGNEFENLRVLCRGHNAARVRGL